MIHELYICAGGGGACRENCRKGSRKDCLCGPPCWGLWLIHRRAVRDAFVYIYIYEFLTHWYDPTMKFWERRDTRFVFVERPAEVRDSCTCVQSVTHICIYIYMNSRLVDMISQRIFGKGWRKDCLCGTPCWGSWGLERNHMWQFVTHTCAWSPWLIFIIPQWTLKKKNRRDCLCGPHCWGSWLNHMRAVHD